MHYGEGDTLRCMRKLGVNFVATPDAISKFDPPPIPWTHG